MKEKVISFIASKTHMPKDKITLDSKMEGDFGMGDLDTGCFYEEFFLKFEICNTEDFDLGKYMTPDVFPSPWLLIKAIFSESARKQLRVEEVSVRHLIRVAEAKYWTEEQ